VDARGRKASPILSSEHWSLFIGEWKDLHSRSLDMMDAGPCAHLEILGSCGWWTSFRCLLLE